METQTDSRPKNIFRRILSRLRRKIRHLLSEIRQPSPVTLVGFVIGSAAGRMVAYGIAFLFALYLGLYSFAFVMAFGVACEYWTMHHLGQHFISHLRMQAVFIQHFSQ